MKKTFKLAYDALIDLGAEDYEGFGDVLDALEEALAQPEQERCVGCEACIDTACGRDECPKGWPKAAQPEQEPAWYHAECNDPDHSGFFKEAIDAVTQVNEHGGFVTKLYTTPPQRKPLTDEQIIASNYPDGEENGPTIAAPDFELICFARQIEAAHGIKE